MRGKINVFLKAGVENINRYLKLCNRIFPLPEKDHEDIWDESIQRYITWTGEEDFPVYCGCNPDRLKWNFDRATPGMIHFLQHDGAANTGLTDWQKRLIEKWEEFGLNRHRADIQCYERWGWGQEVFAYYNCNITGAILLSDNDRYPGVERLEKAKIIKIAGNTRFQSNDLGNYWVAISKDWLSEKVPCLENHNVNIGFTRNEIILRNHSMPPSKRDSLVDRKEFREGNLEQSIIDAFNELCGKLDSQENS